MQTLGVWLRQAREARGATLKDAEEATHIRVRFLDALEVGDLAAFPGSDVQICGFLRIYARYLGLPADEVLSRYNVEGRIAGAAPSDAPAVAKPARPRSRSTTRPSTAPFSTSTSRPRWMSAETLLIACIVLVLLLVVAAGGWYFIDQRWGGEEAVATAAATAPAGSASLSTPATTPTISPLVTPTFLAN
ncbi:MAG: helix-turn-helix domain-containing protein, partial [Chloroflexota bacterium]|nr:helix-turn-helix domain-containing protein [Chloroflexota bacterium]